MTADQLKAAAADKNASAVCTIVTTIAGTVGKVVFVNLDQKVITNGTVSADDKCNISISNAVKEGK